MARKQSLNRYYRKALVTGASSGLGRAFADSLLAEGLEVWGSARRLDSLQDVAGLHPLQLDLSHLNGVEEVIGRLLEEEPDIDLVINNAGYGAFFPLEDFAIPEIRNQLTVLLTAPMVISRAFYASMKRRGSGALVNVSSLAGRFPLPFMSAYNAAKAGISSFSQSLIIEAEGSGVFIIDLQLGDFRTAFNRHVIRRREVERSEEALSSCWRTMEGHLSRAPVPEVAARRLVEILMRRRGGVYTMGSGFQAVWGPLVARFLPRSVILAYLRRYYCLGERG